LLKTFYDKVKKSKVFIGAQNCHPNSEYGAFTGSVNAKLIKSTGAKFVIIGHSENRNQGDSDQIINNKIKSTLKENLKVIFCVGEKLEDKKKNKTKKVLKRQIKKGLHQIKKTEKIIIAYEPVWSIGTGLIPSNSELQKNINYIRRLIESLRKFNNIKILYGGSVNPNNVKNLSKINGINGFIVGGSSINAKKFIDIIKKSIN